MSENNRERVKVTLQLYEQYIYSEHLSYESLTGEKTDLMRRFWD